MPLDVRITPFGTPEPPLEPQRHSRRHQPQNRNADVLILIVVLVVAVAIATVLSLSHHL
jgi:hypothetical protein